MNWMSSMRRRFDVAILGAKLSRAVVPDGIDELVGEAFRREVEQAKRGVEAGDLVTDGVEKMRLAETDTAVDEQRVVGSGRQLGNRVARGLGELVRIPDDERIERVARERPVGAEGAASRGTRGAAPGAGTSRSISKEMRGAPPSILRAVDSRNAT
jgi:hypothetical protein